MAKENKIITEGQENFRHSKTYHEKVSEIKREIHAKYEGLINAEPNLIKRFALKIKMRLEIRKEISKLNSLENLHLKTS